MPPETDALGGRLWTADELAARWFPDLSPSVRRRRVYRATSEYGLKAVRWGRALLYRESDVAEWLENNTTLNGTNGHVAASDEPREENVK